MNIKNSLFILFFSTFTFLSYSQNSGQFFMKDLSFLIGNWEEKSGQSTRIECWLLTSDNMIVGASQQVSSRKTTQYEFLRIFLDDSGDIYFEANPSGQTKTLFKLVEVKGEKAVFENSKHDFPQKIIYRIVSKGRLTATIEGVIKGEKKSIDFPMVRVNFTLP